MTDPEIQAQSLSPTRPSTWLDLVLYLVVGYGLIVVIDIGLSLAFRGEISIVLTFALYIANALILGGTVYLLGVLRGRTTWGEIGVLPKAWKWDWLWIAMAIVVVSVPARAILGLVAQQLLGIDVRELQGRMALLLAGGGFTWLSFGLTLLGAGIIAPMAEEVYFRGLIHRWFVPRMGFWPRVLLSSVIFGLAHIDSVVVMLSAFVLGVINAFAYEKSRSLWLPILVHMGTNSVAVVLLYLIVAFMPRALTGT